jgi:hypothetical protein
MRFRTTIELGGKTATGFRVPPEVVASFGPRKRVPVRVTIGGHTYRSTVAPYGEAFMIPLSAENRTSAGVAAGDEVEVDIEPDTEPREVTVPPAAHRQGGQHAAGGQDPLTEPYPLTATTRTSVEMPNRPAKSSPAALPAAPRG